MKKSLLLIVPCLLSLISCNEVSSNISSSEEISIELTDLPETDLRRPKKEIDSLEELTYALDYLTFYEIRGKVTFKIAYTYFNTIKRMKFEFSKARENSTIGDLFLIELDETEFKDNHIISLEVYPKDFSYEKSKGNKEVTLLPSINRKKETPKEGVKYKLQKENKGEVRVSNSEQYYYCVSKGYLPVPLENSKANEIDKEVKNVLSYVYNEENTNFQNLKNIFDYLTHDIEYDRVASKSIDFDLEKNQAYFLEGALINKLAVCDGKAKAYQTLCNYIGIENVRIRATNDKGAKHAYNYVNLDGTWYLSCPTSGANIIDLDNISYQVPSYEMFLTNLETALKPNWTYESVMFKDIEELISKESFAYFENENLVFNDEVALKSKIEESVRDNSSRQNFSLEFKASEESNLNILDVLEALKKEFPKLRFEGLKHQVENQDIYSILVLNV